MRPHVLVDDSPAFNQGAGIGRYARNVVAAAARYWPEAQWTLAYGPDSLSGSPFAAEAIAGFPAGTVQVSRLPVSWQWSQRLWHRAGLPLPIERLARAGRPDIVYSPDFTVAPTAGIPRVATIHDLGFAIRPDLTPAPLRRYLHAAVRRTIGGAAHLIVVSDTTRNDLISWFGVPEDTITVVPNGVDERFFDATLLPDTTRTTLGVPKRYLLMVGTIEPRKNHATLLDAFELLSNDLGLSLVFAGRPGWDNASIVGRIGRLQADGRALLLQDIDDTMLPSLYAGAAVVVCPSWYEGFGLPVIEALAAGVPVVTSQAPALIEVGGDATITFPAADVHALVSAIERALANDQQTEDARTKRRIRARRWDWESAGARLAATLETVAATNRQ